MDSSDVGSDDEHRDTKARQVLRRLQTGKYDSYFANEVYRCPFCKRRLASTDFNCLVSHAESISSGIPRVGETVNVHAFSAKHQALGIHLRNIQRVAIADGRMAPIKPKAPKIKGQGSKKWRKRQGLEWQRPGRVCCCCCFFNYYV